MDISATLVPKSDQMNADDLIIGPRTITVTKVDVALKSEQPVSIYFDGDNGRPWRPCKSMRRVLAEAWGPDSSHYVGRRITIFREPGAMYGGQQVGGIRLSHLSHINGPITVMLTASRGKRVPYKVQPLLVAPVTLTPVAAPPAPYPAAEELVLAAEQSCRHSGLTDAGIAAFVLEYSQGSTSDLKDAPPDALVKITRQGISSQTVERFNAAPAAAEPAPSPASQPASIDTQAASSEPEPVEPGTVERLPQGQTVIAADPQPEPTPAAARRVAHQVRRSAPAAPPAAEAPSLASTDRPILPHQFPAILPLHGQIH